jgi:putative sporulation protein YtxC
LNIEGYILFRLKNYVDDIALLVENAIDEYRLEQQYQEFITLLKYFVYIQDVKISLVHVIHKSEHDFDIVDDQLQAVHFSKKDAFCKLEMIDHHVNVDDMLISTLVSVSPARICIHSQTPHTPVIEMIHQIFEDRVKLCTHCRTCQSYIGESKQ